MVRHERLGIGAARNRVQHRRFHFKEAIFEHVAADGGNCVRAREEAFARLFVHDEVDVALTVAELRILQALVLVGKRTDALGHEANAVDADGEVARLRAEERTRAGDDVAKVERLEVGVGFGADRVLLHEVLHDTREVAYGGKARLAHDALEHHAARAGHLRGGGFEFFNAHVAVLGAQIAEEVLADEVVRESDARFAKLLELGAAFGNDVVLFLRRFGCGVDFVFCHLLKSR